MVTQGVWDQTGQVYQSGSSGARCRNSSSWTYLVDVVLANTDVETLHSLDDQAIAEMKHYRCMDMVLSLQAGQQIMVAEAKRTEMLQMLQSVQASNKKQADMLQSQKAAIRQSPEVVQIQQLEDAIQQTQEVVWRCVRTCLDTVPLMNAS